jgi:hypothetical protein
MYPIQLAPPRGLPHSLGTSGLVLGLRMPPDVCMAWCVSTGTLLTLSLLSSDIKARASTGSLPVMDISRKYCFLALC